MVDVNKGAEIRSRHGEKKYADHFAENKDNRTVAAMKENGKIVTVYYMPRCTCG